MKFKCTTRDRRPAKGSEDEQNPNYNCNGNFCLNKKGIFVFKDHSEECLQTQKLYDINLLKQKIGLDLWSRAISHVTCIRKINASQDECFKSFKNYIKGISFTIIYYQYDLYGTVYQQKLHNGISYH